MKPEETIDFHIRWAWSKIARMYNCAAQEHGSSMSMAYALINIDARNGTPSTKLGPQMGMESRSLTRILTNMEERGWICRKKDKSDGRMVRIHLTEDGKKKRELAKSGVIKFNKEVRENIAPNKLATFMEVMIDLNDLLDKKVGTSLN